MIASIDGLAALLEKSAATEDFKRAVHDLEQGQKNPLIDVGFGAPAVKVLRTIAQLLDQEPALAIERVSVKARSGCSDFFGTLTVNDDAEFAFTWDCKWKAEEQGWNDPYGYPDQARAAQVFGYQCFKKFERVK